MIIILNDYHVKSEGNTIGQSANAIKSSSYIFLHFTDVVYESR